MTKPDQSDLGQEATFDVLSSGVSFLPDRGRPAKFLADAGEIVIAGGGEEDEPITRWGDLWANRRRPSQTLTRPDQPTC